MAHWRNVLNPTVVKGKGSWTPEEDLALQRLVQEHGRTKWSVLLFFFLFRFSRRVVDVFFAKDIINNYRS